MSGTWRDRLDARLPLRERDIEVALREVKDSTAAGETAASDIAGLTARLDAIEARVAALETEPQKPARRGSKADE